MYVASESVKLSSSHIVDHDPLVRSSSRPSIVCAPPDTNQYVGILYLFPHKNVDIYFIVPKTLNYLAFQTFDFERT
jgi:translation initiation factor 2B subunit (eIF-2B alpha/beta/delta family)